MLASRATAAALVLAAAGLLSSPARAELVFMSNTDLTGQGLGATTTALTLQSPGSTTTESGGVLFGGTTFGNAGQQSNTFTLSTLGITSTSQLALVVNLSEPNSESPPSVTTALSPLAANANLANTITLNVYSQTGTLLTSFSTASGQTLDQIASGIGGSGLVFGLTPDEALSLDALLAQTAGTEVFTVGATFTNASGGLDAIQAAAITGIPELSTWAMMMVGFAGIGFVAYRRRSPAPFRLV
jgi:hypothetical protein